MSAISHLFSDFWDDSDCTHRLFDQNFGLGIHPDQLLPPRSLTRYMPTGLHRRPYQHLVPSFYNRVIPWNEILRNKEEGGISTIKSNKDKFEVVLDVQQFDPEEINVKVMDKFVVVEAKHEEKQDEHGWISRQFVRKYMIPEPCDIDQVTSTLSSDGVLSIIAPRKDHPKTENERMIKIEHTGKPAVQNAQKAQVKAREEAQEEAQEKK